MKNTPHDLNTKLSLTAEERAALKRDFMSFMSENPPVLRKEPVRILSPYFPHLVRVPVFAMAFLALVGGTAYAAENSLPNDLLYPIKTEIIEPLFIEAPARTPIAKAEASQKLVERRLEEAETLIDNNELDEESVAVIAAAVDEHTNNVQAFVASASQSGELSDALEVGTDLENVLEAHGEVLESIAEDSTATEAVTNLIETIADQADEAEAISETIEDKTAETVTDETDEYLNATVSDVQTALESLRGSLADFTGQDEELITEATSYLTQSQSSYEAGTSYLSLGQKSAALPQLRDALQFAEQGLILIESHEELSAGDVAEDS
jgi:hypothetical protein